MNLPKRLSTVRSRLEEFEWHRSLDQTRGRVQRLRAKARKARR